MKLNCLIVDDEPLAHNVIIEYAKDVDYLSITGQAYLPTVAMQLLKEQTIDLIFLDIQMPRLNGLEMLRLIEDKPEVIITSAYEEYALESYDLQVCDYLLKPFRFDRFLQATEKALQNHKLRSKPFAAQSDKLLIKVDKKLMNVSGDEIIYIKSYGNYVKVHTEHQCLVTARTLSSFIDELSSGDFCQIHKSYLINKHHMRYVEGNEVTMIKDIKLPISKNYKGGLINDLKS
jgi:DNA-binding LytR/AlgR family response regulator